MSSYKISLVAAILFLLFVASTAMSFSMVNQNWHKENEYVTDCYSIEKLALKASNAFPVLASATEIISLFESNDLEVRAEFFLIKGQSIEKVLSPEKAADDPSFIHLAFILIHHLFSCSAYDTISTYCWDYDLHALLDRCQPSTITEFNRMVETYIATIRSNKFSVERFFDNIWAKLLVDKFQGDHCMLKRYLNQDFEMEMCKEGSDIVEFLQISRKSFNELEEMSIAVEFFMCQKSDPSHCHVFRMLFPRDSADPKIIRWRKLVMVALLDPFYGMKILEAKKF